MTSEFAPQEIVQLREALEETRHVFGRRFGVQGKSVWRWEQPESSASHRNPHPAVLRMLSALRKQVYGVVK